MILRTTIASAALMVLMVGSWGGEVGPARQSSTHDAAAVEPDAARAFVVAYALGDDGAAALAASPLYAAEWARRGLGALERQALLPQLTEPGGARAPWIAFALAGEIIDVHGFRHLLYAASQPTCDSGCHASSVWRVDTDPSGRVIWAEMVWLFSSHVTSVVTSPGRNGLRQDLLPDTFAARQPRLLVAVRSATSVEGFYAVAMDGDPHMIVFFALGPDDGARPGAWSFGSRTTGPSEYGGRAAAPLAQLSVGDEALQRSYLAGLS